VKIFSREYLEQRGMIMMNITNCKKGWRRRRRKI
jgi:hypothetical protein